VAKVSKRVGFQKIVTAVEMSQRLLKIEEPFSFKGIVGDISTHSFSK
jgi:hypothetical protein